MNEKKSCEGAKKVRRFSSEDVFPNHLALSCLGYVADLGSFDLDMYELKDVALDCIRCLKKIESEGKRNTYETGHD